MWPTFCIKQHHLPQVHHLCPETPQIRLPSPKEEKIHRVIWTVFCLIIIKHFSIFVNARK